MRGILWAAAVAFLLKLGLAVFTVGTNDALTWEHDLMRLKTAGFAELYRSGVQYNSPSGRPYLRQSFIHPPAMLHLLLALGKLQDASGLPLRFWLRAACALADAALLGLLIAAGRASRQALFVLALSPVSVLVSGFHANTDPILVLFAVAAVLLAEEGRPLVSGLAFGIACGIKLVPLLFAPAILLHLLSRRSRAWWMAASLATWVVFSLPYLAQEPTLILKTMLGYDSATGLWGFSLLPTLFGGSGPVQSLYAACARWIALLAASSAPLWLRLRGRRPPLLVQCGLVTFVFLFLSPGFGLQYLCWTMPWTVRLPFRWIAVHHLVAGGFLLSVYAAAVHGSSYADLLTPQHFSLLILMGLICWMEIGTVAWRCSKCCCALQASWEQAVWTGGNGGPEPGARTARKLLRTNSASLSGDVDSRLP